MYAVCGKRTMANARPKFRRPEDMPVVRTIEEIRAEKQAAAQLHELRCRARRLEQQAREREAEAERIRIAQEQIDKANRAITEYRTSYRTPYSKIVRLITRATGVSVKEIMGPGRKANIVIARQAIYYWTRRLTLASFPRIGQMMGGRDHTTCLHGALEYPRKRARQGRYLRGIR